jgi:methylated-DNA-protein-cysteine methyltransferase-like protein
MASGMFEAMLKTVKRIPKGRVATYGDVATASGYPGCARQVVWALRSGGPGGRNVPWHRVLGAKGKILLTGESAFEQQLRLRTEDVLVAGGRVDLKRFGHRFAR